MWAFLLQPYTRRLAASCGADAACTLDREHGKTNPHTAAALTPEATAGRPAGWLTRVENCLLVCTATNTNVVKPEKSHTVSDSDEILAAEGRVSLNEQ